MIIVMNSTAFKFSVISKRPVHMGNRYYCFHLASKKPEGKGFLRQAWYEGCYGGELSTHTPIIGWTSQDPWETMATPSPHSVWTGHHLQLASKEFIKFILSLLREWSVQDIHFRKIFSKRLKQWVLSLSPQLTRKLNEPKRLHCIIQLITFCKMTDKLPSNTLQICVVCRTAFSSPCDIQVLIKVRVITDSDYKITRTHRLVEL